MHHNSEFPVNSNNEMDDDIAELVSAMDTFVQKILNMKTIPNDEFKLTLGKKLLNIREELVLQENNLTSKGWALALISDILVRWDLVKIKEIMKTNNKVVN